MRRRTLFKGFLPAAMAAGPSVLYAETYLNTEQAQHLLFSGESLTSAPMTLSDAQEKAIEKASGVNVREKQVKAWKSTSGGWFILDNAVGKHEFIDFALALTAGGAVKGVEILTYRETYGGEVRQPKWRAQFSGKTTAQPVKIDKDIKNISGATLSSVHMTDAIRRLLYTCEIALKH
jgi:Na+-translocating ferredoxin:NAD+ oxidoreductase RnfG subunit